MLIKQTFIIAICLCALGDLFAQTGSKYTVEQAKEILYRHNFYRSEVGVSDLKWSNEAAAYAQKWAEHLAAEGCNLEHSNNGKYGENLFWGSGRTYKPSFVVDSWASEKSDWKGGKITMKNYAKAGHYTQMIWYSTTHVGCGQAVCSNGNVIVSCSYSPPGNVIGQTPTKIKLMEEWDKAIYRW